jgi:5-methyltetrahydrofolate--homocysteine methyltransferase
MESGPDMPSSYLELVRRRLVLYDGAMGTMLFAAGLLDGESPEPWNWERPELVRDIYRAYYDAGSDAVQTNTFGGTPIKLSERELQERTHEANALAAKQVRAVCPPGRFVAGNVGPIGKFLKPMGEYTIEEFQDNFAAQIQALVDGGVDFLSMETMYSLDEALCAVRAARQVCSLPVSVCMTFDKNPRGFFTLMGETVPRCMKALADAGADIVGSNCSHGSPVFLELARLIRDSTDLPVIVQPNRGRPTLEGGQVIYKQTAEEFVADMRQIAALGVNVVGGCCGTNPEFITRLAAALHQRLADPRPDPRTQENRA